MALLQRAMGDWRSTHTRGGRVVHSFNRCRMGALLALCSSAIRGRRPRRGEGKDLTLDRRCCSARAFARAAAAAGAAAGPAQHGVEVQRPQRSAMLTATNAGAELQAYRQQRGALLRRRHALLLRHCRLCRAVLLRRWLSGFIIATTVLHWRLRVRAAALQCTPSHSCCAPLRAAALQHSTAVAEHRSSKQCIATPLLPHLLWRPHAARAAH